MSHNEEFRTPHSAAVADGYMEDDAAFESHSVTLSVVTDGPRICFAAYNDDSREVWIEECLANGYEVPAVVERVILQLQPTLILVSSKLVANQALLKILTTVSQEVDDEGAGDADAGSRGHVRETRPRSIPYQALKSSSFDVRSCKALIMQKLMVESITRHRQGPAQRDPNRHFHGQASAQQPSFAVSRYHALASVIDLESTVQLQALGSLLSFMSKTLFPTSEGGYIVVRDIIRGNFSLYMNVTSAALSALHIFSTERHPLMAANGTGNSKEGFSLFSLLDNTKSRGGRQRLREWMTKPLLEVDAIKQRQDGVELFLLPDFQDVLGTLLKLLERVGPVDNIIKRMEKCVSQPNDFFVLARSLKAALKICGTLHQDILWSLQKVSRDDQADRYIAFVSYLLRGCSPDKLGRLLEVLSGAIDEEATSVWGSTSMIRDGFCPQLDELKDTYYQIGNVLEEVGVDLVQQMPYLHKFLDVVFFPQIGFLVRLIEDPSWSADDLPDDFEYIYADGGYVHYKDQNTRAMDMQYGDLDAKIKDKEASIVAKLEEEIIGCREVLQETFSALADLDCILSFAVRASDSGYVRPDVVDAKEDCILIRNGRHPLQEMHLGKKFVPNDTLVDSQNRVNIITGPNFSGKSCYARQVGVLVYMAHIGCYLPCDAAQISIVREILVRFSAIETCAIPQSTFQLDLSQMGNILRLASPGSLILIDEFGKGTSPASGIALLESAIQALIQSQAKVICTTHFVEIFSMGMLVDGTNGIKARQMSIKIPTRSTDIAVPLFKLEEGVSDSSAGLVCAQMAGLNQGIIDRAGELIQAGREGKPISPLEEIYRSNLPFTKAEFDLLRQFVRRDWNEATDDEIKDLLDTIHGVQGMKE